MNYLLIQLSVMDIAVVIGIAYLIIISLPTTNKKLRDELTISRGINKQDQKTITYLTTTRQTERSNFSEYKKETDAKIERLQITIEILTELSKIPNLDERIKKREDQLRKNEDCNPEV